jgi:hypothetical protein
MRRSGSLFRRTGSGHRPAGDPPTRAQEPGAPALTTRWSRSLSPHWPGPVAVPARAGWLTPEVASGLDSDGAARKAWPAAPDLWMTAGWLTRCWKTSGRRCRSEVWRLSSSAPPEPPRGKLQVEVDFFAAHDRLGFAQGVEVLKAQDGAGLPAKLSEFVLFHCLQRNCIVVIPTLLLMSNLAAHHGSESMRTTLKQMVGVNGSAGTCHATNTCVRRSI